MARLPARDRLRASLTLSSFEMVMPVVGLGVGRGLGAAIGDVADDVAAAFLVALALYLLVAEEDDNRVESLPGHGGVALLAVGISVSLDELAIGFSIGLLDLSIWLAVVLIGAQAFAFAQVGLRLGARLGDAGREWAERLAGLALLALGILILAEKLAA